MKTRDIMWPLSYKTQNRIYIAGIVVLIVTAFGYSQHAGMGQTVPEAIGRHTSSIGIAISNIEYGLPGYMGYGQIFNILSENGMTSRLPIAEKHGLSAKEMLTNGPLLNRAIEKTLSLDSSGWIEKYPLAVEDRGFIDYCRIAFSFFGLRVESLLYLYYVILILTVSLYVISFYNRREYLQLLCLFLISHLIAVIAAPKIGIDLQTVHNIRFLPVIALLPAIHLAIMLVDFTSISRPLLLYTGIQAAVLVFVIHIRFSLLCAVAALCALYFLSCLYSWKRTPGLGLSFFYKKRCWPLVLVFAMIAILKLHQALVLSPDYIKNGIGNKMIWHSLYIGLSTHPESQDKYDIIMSDNTSYFLAREIANKKYDMKDIGYGALYERILKDEYMKILVNDPIFVLENAVIYKPFMFLQNFYKYYFDIYALVFAFILGAVAGRHFSMRWLYFLLILSLLFAFSVLPTMLDLPFAFLITEAALILNTAILLFAAGIANQLIGYVLRDPNYS